MTQPVVIAGATGFVGRHIAAALQEAGVTVRCGSRNPERASQRWPDEHWVHLDVAKAHSLESALEGAKTLVYLVHHMGQATGDLFLEEDASAQRVIRAAEKAGVAQIIYLGGPSSPQPSKHLRARMRTGEVLRSGAPATVELRASMIIGQDSQSWLIVRDLAKRLPLMILPSWLRHKTQPIAIDDVTRALVRCCEVSATESTIYSLPGPATLTGRAILEQVSACSGIRPVMIPVPVLTPRLSSHWLRFVTRANYTLARQLVDGFVCDLVADEPSFWDAHADLPRTPLAQAVQRCLDEESQDAMGAFARRWESLVQTWARKATT